MAIAYLPSEQSDAKKTCECIEEAGQKAVLLPGDLTDEAYARQLVHDVHKQLGGLDIVVNNAVAPGPIWTPLQPSYGQSLEKLVQFDNDAPLGRPGQPAELAGAYVFLASDEASYVSGEVIGVPGGKLR